MDTISLEVRDFLDRYKQLLLCPQLNPDYVIVDAKRDPALQPSFFYYEDNDGAYYHPFQKFSIVGTPYYQIRSPYGCGGAGGGPVATCQEPVFINRVFTHIKQWCKENQVIFEKVKFHPLLDNANYYYGKVTFVQNDVFTDLSVPNLVALYRGNTRTAIKKAQKSGVQVRFATNEEFLLQFPSMYRAIMDVNEADDFFHFNREYFSGLCELDISYNLIATYQDEVVAGAVFLIQDKILEYHLSAATQLGKQLNATSLLLNEAFNWAKSKGCEFAYLGGRTNPVPNDSLEYFKLGFAGQLIPHKYGTFVHDVNVYNSLVKDKLI